MAKRKINKLKDSDGDGLPDEVEKFFGTDPNNPDTDGDGMPDGDEIKLGRNPKGPGLLKDLFIPHAGNDFQPKALHPYRLLFYALSSILLKTILIAAVVVLPMEAWLTPDILIEQSKKIISLTNAIRKNLNVSELSENSLLDQAAYNKAEDMLINQYFSHTGPDGRALSYWLKQIKYNFSVAGENLALGFSTPEEVVDAWSRSQTHYKNMIDPDFSEIGVGVTSGPYSGVDTTLVAQYFGAQVIPAVQASAEAPAVKTAVAKPEEKKPVVTPAAIAPVETEILGQKTATTTATSTAAAEIAPSAPTIDLEKSKLYIDQPAGQNQTIVRAEVYLGADAAKARVAFGNYTIDLKPSGDGGGEWTGQTLIFGENQGQIFNPVVLASVTAENRNGVEATADLKWENVKPANTTALEQYYFIKQHQPSYVRPLFDITSIYYKIILGLAVIALALNIFIEIKKQHPHLIVSTLCLISVLFILIII